MTSSFNYVSQYADVLNALESIDAKYMTEDELMFALESDTIANVNKEYNKKMTELSVRLNQAYEANDKKAALEVLDDVEKLLVEWKAKLRSLPKEGGSALKTALKIAAIIVCFAAIMAIPAARAKIVQRIINKIPSIAASGTKKAIVTVGSSVLSLFATHKLAGKAIGGIFDLFMQKAYSNESKDNPEYTNDENVKNKTYMASLGVIDESLAILKEARKQVETGANDPSRPNAIY